MTDVVLIPEQTTVVVVEDNQVYVYYVGIQGPSGNGVGIRAGNMSIASPTNSTILLVAYQFYPLTVLGLYGLKTTSGTIVVTVKINNTAVTGLSNITVNTTPQNILATALNLMVEGDTLSVVLSSVSTPVNLVFSMKTMA